VIDFASRSALAAVAAMEDPRTYAILLGFAGWFVRDEADAIVRRAGASSMK
jgi:hypothetical protein